MERLQPFFEYGPHLIVPHHADAAEFSRTGVVVKIGVQLVIFGLGLHGLAIREMLLHIRLRSQQAFFFAAPQRDPYGTVHLQVQSFENAHSLDRHRRTSGIVGGARATVPGIQVRSQHHDLILLPSALDFADHVERIRRRIDELRLDIELQLYRNVVL